MKWLSSLLHLFYPHLCAGCGSDSLQAADVICAQCMGKLPYTGFPAQEGNPVEKLFYGRLRIHAAASALYFTRDSIVQHIMVELKYRKHREAGLWLGRMLGEQLQASGRFTAINAIIPVPLHPRRLRERGYNQASLLAQGISEVYNIPVLEQAIGRQLYTTTQTQQGRAGRITNLKNAFILNEPEAVRDKHILLTDDVLTTGSTLELCGQVLLPARPASINIATAAYTLL